MNSTELIRAVVDWAEQKGIFDKGTVQSQTEKFLEEVKELEEELACYNKYSNENIMLEMGDVLVTLILLAEMHNFSIFEALQMAYNKIAKRQGEMRNGVFVKSEDLDD